MQHGTAKPTAGPQLAGGFPGAAAVCLGLARCLLAMLTDGSRANITAFSTPKRCGQNKLPHCCFSLCTSPHCDRAHSSPPTDRRATQVGGVSPVPANLPGSVRHKAQSRLWSGFQDKPRKSWNG